LPVALDGRLPFTFIPRETKLPTAQIREVTCDNDTTQTTADDDRIDLAIPIEPDQ